MDRTRLPFFHARPGTESAFDLRDQQEPFEYPEPVRAPEGAPNVLLILLDDMGFGASSAFGGPCRMPVAEELARNGLKYTRFHTTGICSPTRAALLSGRNHHSVGMGNLTNFATSSPGYDAMRTPDKGTLAQTLKYNGYATGAFGKWHQTPFWETSAVGPFDHWPIGEGFDKFYGILGGASSQYSPSIVDGVTLVGPPDTEDLEDYHFSEAMVDETMDWIRQIRNFDKSKPWFTYLSFGATHAPFHVPRSWRDRYQGEFSHGWDAQREVTLRRQKQLGVVPEDAELAPWAEGVPHWDELSQNEKLVSARLMELYAAFAEHTDEQIGRLVTFLRDIGDLDNTLIVYVLGDNGASAEGGFVGSMNEWATANGYPKSAEETIEQLDEIGGPNTSPHYSVGWALAMNTPYQWTKQVASHYGGTRNGTIVHWPARIGTPGEVRHQWHHVIDVSPTVLEAAGLPHPDEINGIDQAPLEGASFLYSLDDADAADRHETQYFELFGNRGIYHEGWTAVTQHRIPWKLSSTEEQASLHDDVWELYDTSKDWSQAHNIAHEYPHKLAELQELFLTEARKYGVLPLDDRGVIRMVNSDWPRLDSHRRIVLGPSDRYLASYLVPIVRNTSFVVEMVFTADSNSSQGVIISQGGYFGGWSIYLADGRPSYVHNLCSTAWLHVHAEETIPEGEHTLEFRFDYDGGGLGKGGTGTFLLNGKVIGSGRVEHTVPITFGNETLSVGIDPGSPVAHYNRPRPNPFTGRIRNVTILLAEDKVPVPRGQDLAVEFAAQ